MSEHRYIRTIITIFCGHDEGKLFSNHPAPEKEQPRAKCCVMRDLNICPDKTCPGNDPKRIQDNGKFYDYGDDR